MGSFRKAACEFWLVDTSAGHRNFTENRHCRTNTAGRIGFIKPPAQLRRARPRAFGELLRYPRRAAHGLPRPGPRIRSACSLFRTELAGSGECYSTVMYSSLFLLPLSFLEIFWRVGPARKLSSRFWSSDLEHFPAELNRRDSQERVGGRV
jgi:hypothetical protein